MALIASSFLTKLEPVIKPHAPSFPMPVLHSLLLLHRTSFYLFRTPGPFRSQNPCADFPWTWNHLLCWSARDGTQGLTHVCSISESHPWPLEYPYILCLVNSFSSFKMHLKYPFAMIWMSVSFSQNMCWNLIPNAVLIGRDFGWWLGHEDSDLVNGLVSCKRRKPTKLFALPPSTMWWHRSRPLWVKEQPSLNCKKQISIVYKLHSCRCYDIVGQMD
jgi:hypothetical protein